MYNKLIHIMRRKKDGMVKKIIKLIGSRAQPHPADVYQIEAVFTRGTRGFRDTLVMCSFGLMGETGEAIDEFKKILFHNKPVNLEKVKSELGDILWYLAVVSNLFGINLSDLMEYNLQKLRERYPDGWVEHEKQRR